MSLVVEDRTLTGKIRRKSKGGVISKDRLFWWPCGGFAACAGLIKKVHEPPLMEPAMQRIPKKDAYCSVQFYQHESTIGRIPALGAVYIGGRALELCFVQLSADATGGRIALDLLLVVCCCLVGAFFLWCGG